MSHPTDYHPGATDERLRTLAAVLARVRNEALSAYEPFSGERKASLGMRTFERASKAFDDRSNVVDWLDVHHEEGACILVIDKVFALKFHRGDPEHPRAKTKIECAPELHAKQRAFTFMASLPMLRQPRPEVLGSKWRIYYMDDADSHEIVSVWLARLDDEGNTAEFWSILLGDRVRVLSPVAAPVLPEAAELEQPVITLREVEPVPEPVRAESEIQPSAPDAANDADT
jgi:hypothetical protein